MGSWDGTAYDLEQVVPAPLAENPELNATSDQRRAYILRWLT